MTKKPTDRTLSEWKPLPLSRQPFVLLLTAAILGILLDEWQQLPLVNWLLLAIVACVGMAVATKSVGLISLMGIVAVSAGAWHALHQRHYANDDIVIWTDERPKPLVVEVVICSQIEHHANELAALRRGNLSPWQAHVEVEVFRIREHATWRSASGRARLVVDARLDELLYGDRIRLTCEAQRPGPPTNPGETDFRQTFASQRTLVRLHAEDKTHVRLLSRGAWSWQRGLAWMSRRGEAALEAAVGEQYSSLATAIVLGRRAIPEPLRDNLIETGTVHVSVVSGLHLGIVALAINWLTNFFELRVRWRVVFVIGGCLLYALVTGWRPPVVRALVLVVVVLVGRVAGRRGDSLHLLAMASLMLILVNPAWLGQIGTQLSILAVAGLILAESRELRDQQAPTEDPLDQLLSARRPAWVRFLGRYVQSIKRGAMTSLCVTVMTTPLIWHHFHVVSFVSIIANIVISPLVLLALLSGLLCALLGGVWLPLGYPFGWICSVLLKWIDTATLWLSDLPLSHIWWPGPSGALTIIFYLSVLAMIVMCPTRRRLGLMLVAAIWLVIVVATEFRSTTPNTTTVTFIDVGHGTSVLVQPPQSLPWLYDAGRMGAVSQSARPIEAVLWQARIRRLGGLVLSHADADHYCAVAQLLRRFRFDCVVVAPGMFDQAPPLLKEVRDTITKQGIPLLEMTAGETLQEKTSLKAHVLHPPASWPKGKDNAASLTLDLQYESLSLILPGDLESPGTNAVIAQPRPRPGALLMSPHHGSLAEDPLPFIEWARPDCIVVSGGKNALRPAVRDRLQAAGSQVWITASDGAVRVQWLDGRWKAQGFLTMPW